MRRRPDALSDLTVVIRRRKRCFREIRALIDPEALLRRFPAPPHFTAPWIGTRRVACAAGAEETGRILADLYGPAVALCGIDEGPDAVARPDPSLSACDAAIELGCSITSVRYSVGTSRSSAHP